MQFEHAEFSIYQIPCPQTVRWKDAVEDGGLFALVRRAGTDGVAEGPIKPIWKCSRLEYPPLFQSIDLTYRRIE